MARYPQGQPFTIPITVKQRTTDGTYTSPAHDSTGNYHQDIPAADINAIGHYLYAVVTTGTGAGVIPGEFDVFDPFEQSVLPLQDAKDALNIPQAVTASDTEIAAYVATIESCLEGYTGGPLVNKTITAERTEMMSGQTVIPVRQRPLVSVTSITSASGGAIDISGGLKLDVNAGLIRRPLGLPFYGPFFAWLPECYVTYVAGWGTSAPATFNTVARIILQHLWNTQHGPSSRPSMTGGEETVTPPGFGFAIPNQAAELLAGSQGGVPFLSEAYV